MKERNPELFATPEVSFQDDKSADMAERLDPHQAMFDMHQSDGPSPMLILGYIVLGMLTLGAAIYCYAVVSPPKSEEEIQQAKAAAKARADQLRAAKASGQPTKSSTGAGGGAGP